VAGALVISEHARKRWCQRFKKLRRRNIMETQVERAVSIGSSGGSEYYHTPCGAILVVGDDVVKTVLLGRQLPGSLLNNLRAR